MEIGFGIGGLQARRRTRVVGTFPDRQSAVMLVAARLRHIAGTRWSTRKYLDMSRLREQDQERLFTEEESVAAASQAASTVQPAPSWGSGEVKFLLPADSKDYPRPTCAS